MKDMEHMRLEQALKDVTADRDRLVKVVHRLQSERSEATQKPIAWAVTSPHGDVVHFALSDGWKVEPVMYDERVTSPQEGK